MHAAQERLLIEIKSGQGKPADARAGKRRHGGIAVLAKDERLNAGLTDAGGLRDQTRQSGSIQKGAGGEHRHRSSSRLLRRKSATMSAGFVMVTIGQLILSGRS